MGGQSHDPNIIFGSNVFMQPGSMSIHASGGPKFRKGDLVVQVGGSGIEGRKSSNPIWGANGIFMRGVIYDVEMIPQIMVYQYIVQWENGENNIYRTDACLELFDNAKKTLNKAHTKNKVVLDTSKLDPLVVEPSTKTEIIAVLKQHHNADKMFDEWGLGEVIEYGRGMTFMFYGTPGTGKTWAAHCIAKSLDTKLLVISASQIQSSEPGGANRNIENAFKTAKESKQILFLDECDSLITSRNDVGMIIGSEINTLLTEIEKSEGVVILATNRIDTLDEALERRISLIIEFPKPNFAQREAIWGKMLPKKMPLGEGVTPAKLAEYALTGGQIKNSVLQAARLALSEDAKKVELPHFESAINRVIKSKSLMGTSSRYRQGEDYRKG